MLFLISVLYTQRFSSSLPISFYVLDCLEIDFEIFLLPGLGGGGAINSNWRAVSQYSLLNQFSSCKITTHQITVIFFFF